MMIWNSLPLSFVGKFFNSSDVEKKQTENFQANSSDPDEIAQSIALSGLYFVVVLCIFNRSLSFIMGQLLSKELKPADDMVEQK